MTAPLGFGTFGSVVIGHVSNFHAPETGLEALRDPQKLETRLPTKLPKVPKPSRRLATIVCGACGHLVSTNLPVTVTEPDLICSCCGERQSFYAWSRPINWKSLAPRAWARRTVRPPRRQHGELP